MPVRTSAALALSLFLAACGGAGPTSVPGSSAGSAATPGTGATAGAVVDLSGLDACGLIDKSTVEALTGETGFTTDRNADPSSSTCFWAVPRAGVPQYLEIRVARRTASLGDYTLDVNGAACPSAPVPGVGAEARGGVCVGSQTKVWLIAMDRGVSVQVIVNEPKGALTPADLAAAVNAVIAGVR